MDPSIIRRPRALVLTAMLLLAALLGALLMALAPAPAANAHDATPTPSCTGLRVSAWAYDGSTQNRVVVVIDGETVHEGTFGQSFQRDLPWSTTEDHSYEVTIDQGDGDAYDRRFTGTWEACEQPPTPEVDLPAQPSLQDVCGPAYGEPVLPAADGFAWSVDERDVQDGVGTVVIVATLEPGSAWVGGGTEPREFAFPVTDEPCDVPTAVEGTPTVLDECGPGYAVQLPTTTPEDGYAFSIDESGVVDGDGTVVVVATLADGFTWQDGSTEPRTSSFDVTSEPCVLDDIPAPTFQEVCGVDGETPYEVPADGEHHRYVVTDPGEYVGGERVVEIVAVLDEGFVAGEGVETRWTHAFRDEPCDTPVVGVSSAEVSVQPATCAAPGTAAPGETERASWTVVDVPADGGRATFVATADEGSRFPAGTPGVSADGLTRTFAVDVPAADAALCSVAPPPVQPPAQAAPPVTTQSAPPALPRTGLDVAPILLLGTLLAAAGATMVVRRARMHG